MKKVIAFSMFAAFIFAGCTVKHVTKPSGPSYEQQQKSSDKAFQGM